jgi:hypothetical protein
MARAAAGAVPIAGPPPVGDGGSLAVRSLDRILSNLGVAWAEAAGKGTMRVGYHQSCCEASTRCTGYRSALSACCQVESSATSPLLSPSVSRLIRSRAAHRLIPRQPRCRPSDDRAPPNLRHTAINVALAYDREAEGIAYANVSAWTDHVTVSITIDKQPEGKPTRPPNPGS